MAAAAVQAAAAAAEVGKMAESQKERMPIDTKPQTNFRLFY